MRQFRNYQVYINFPDDEYRRSLRDQFAVKGDSHMVSWLNASGKRLLEIQPHRTPSFEARKYEKDVYDHLQLIYSTMIGQQLLAALGTAEKVWIVPLDDEDREWCDGTACAFPGQPKERGGIRIYYNPRWYKPGSTWPGSDDILFHELVHAYRMIRVGFHEMVRKPIAGNDDYEEFLALQLQNVYLALRSSPRFYRTYLGQEVELKPDVYQYLVDNKDALAALRYFVDNEPFAADVARMMHPVFNPWRDLAILERLHRGRASGRAQHAAGS